MNDTTPGAVPARTLVVEVVIVMWVSLGASALRALLDFMNRLTIVTPLNEQTVSIVTPFTPDRPWLDILYHGAGIIIPLGAVALVWYLLHASGESMATIGVDATEPGRDLIRGLLLFAVIGGGGLLLYLGAVQLGVNAQIAPATIGDQWFDQPVLLLRALESAVLEEVIVLGYLLHRLRQIGVGTWWAIAISAVLRGAYHLYQGIGGFVGNIVMGVIFGWLFLRWRRTMPFIIAHFLIDAVAFIGYALLADRVDWLP